MGLFGRLGTLIRSNINELINRAEDPEKMLNQVLVDMKGQLVEAKKQVAIAIADEKRIKKQYEQELAKAQDWEKKAMLAVRAGNDDLARAALARKAEHDELAATLKEQWEAQKQSVSRQKRAQAQATINRTLSQLNSGDSYDSTFARMDERVTQLEAEAEATAELGALPEASLETQFKALEAGSSVDSELEALKQKMALASGSGGPKAISAGEADHESDDDLESDDSPSIEAIDPKAAEVDAQLEELKRKLSSS
jgi:phage shock protein A